MKKEELESVINEEAAELLDRLSDAGLPKKEIEIHVVYGGCSITVKEYEQNNNSRVTAEEWGDAGISIEDMVRANVNVNELTNREAFIRTLRIKRLYERMQKILYESECAV